MLIVPAGPNHNHSGTKAYHCIADQCHSSIGIFLLERLGLMPSPTTVTCVTLTQFRSPDFTRGPNPFPGTSSLSPYFSINPITSLRTSKFPGRRVVAIPCQSMPYHSDIHIYITVPRSPQIFHSFRLCEPLTPTVGPAFFCGLSAIRFRWIVIPPFSSPTRST